MSARTAAAKRPAGTTQADTDASVHKVCYCLRLSGCRTLLAESARVGTIALSVVLP